ncbi:MAG: arylsulfatase [Planctomycetaceae bacterium]|nr:arylsulfatase [Planctomycetaceae bacterium]
MLFVKRFCLGAIVVGCCAAPALAADASTPPRPPHIVVILADDLGYGDTGCYGATAIPTPNIDRLANEGLRFTRCYAPASTCTPTRYALMTGEYGWRQRRRKTSILDGDAPLAIEPGRPTLPAVLQSAGYHTALVGKWHLGVGDGERPVDFNGRVGPGPLEVGFDEAFYIPATVDRVPCVFIEDHAVHRLDPADPVQISYQRRIGQLPVGRERPDLLKYPADNQHSDVIINGISRIGYMAGGRQAWWVDEEIADTLAQRCDRIIQKQYDGPLFLLVGTHDPHVPHAPHPRFVGKSQCGVRGDSIVQLDWLVGAVLDSLQRAGIAEQTLVLVTSDNGPTVFDGYDDGSVAELGDHRPAGPLRGGKYLVDEGGCRVPLIARWPGRIESGESDEMISLVDLLPSLATLGGVAALPAGVGADGVDASATLLSAQSPSPRDHVVLQGVANGFALVDGPWKFIPSNAAGAADDIGRGANPLDTRFAEARIAEDRLYRLDEDPSESRNLIAEHPEQAVRLRARLQAIRRAGQGTAPQ